MILLCNVCVPTDDFSYNSKGVLVMAKWYPAGGFIAGDDGGYTVRGGIENILDAFLHEHQHKEIPSKNYLAGTGQENPVRLVYERKGLPTI